MYKQRLLKRLIHFNENPNYRLKTKSSICEINSVKEHIKAILSSREDTALISNDYGLSDITNIHNEYFREFILNLENEIYEKLLKYEPRICELKVIFDKSNQKNFYLKFNIEAKLKKDNYSEIFLKSTIYPNGKIELNEQ